MSHKRVHVLGDLWDIDPAVASLTDLKAGGGAASSTAYGVVSLTNRSATSPTDSTRPALTDSSVYFGLPPQLGQGDAGDWAVVRVIGDWTTVTLTDKGLQV
jgi:hypothetical protein